MNVQDRIQRWHDESLTIEDIAFAVSATSSIEVKRVGGDSLIAHSFRVSRMVKYIWPEDKVAHIAALLHDTVEDTPVGLDFIEKGFGKAVAEVVEILTRRENESYLEYIQRILDSGNLSAMKVKFCDALDNSSHYVATVATDGVKPETWLYWRIKYRTLAGLLKRKLIEQFPEVGLSRAMQKAMYVWVRKIDIDGIHVIRDGETSKGPRPCDVYRAILDDENDHLSEDSWYINPWGIPEEVKFAPDKRAGYSGYLMETLYAPLRTIPVNI